MKKLTVAFVRDVFNQAMKEEVSFSRAVELLNEESSNNITAEDIIKKVEKDIDKPFVTAQFGNNWKEHAKKHYDIDAIIDIAWRNGRKALLLEREITEILRH